MFILKEFEEVVRVKPSLFQENFLTTIEQHLNLNMSNKIISNVGLGIALFDLLKIGDSYILPGDGGHHTKVKFRYVIFRPIMGEIILGKVKTCNVDGVCVTLGFFDDILIPASSLQHQSKFDESDRMWIWIYDNDDGNKHELTLDIGDKVKFRVVGEKFNEIVPTGAVNEGKMSTKKEAPYVVIGSMNEPGLGVVTWWEGM